MPFQKYAKYLGLPLPTLMCQSQSPSLPTENHHCFLDHFKKNKNKTRWLLRQLFQISAITAILYSSICQNNVNFPFSQFQYSCSHISNFTRHSPFFHFGIFPVPKFNTLLQVKDYDLKGPTGHPKAQTDVFLR